MNNQAIKGRSISKRSAGIIPAGVFIVGKIGSPIDFFRNVNVLPALRRLFFQSHGR